MENMDKGLTDHCTKMGADSSVENTPNAPKVLDFNEKRLHWASVVRGLKIYWLPHSSSYTLLIFTWAPDRKFEDSFEAGLSPKLQRLNFVKN